MPVAVMITWGRLTVPRTLAPSPLAIFSTSSRRGLQGLAMALDLCNLRALALSCWPGLNLTFSDIRLAIIILWRWMLGKGYLLPV